jgi:hypothetical protein
LTSSAPGISPVMPDLKRGKAWAFGLTAPQ